jgi:alpha-mannosidase
MKPVCFSYSHKVSNTLIGLFLIVLSINFIGTSCVAQTNASATFNAYVQPYYKYRKDGKPGRSIYLAFKGDRLNEAATVKVECSGITEETTIAKDEKGLDGTTLILPPGIGLDKESQARITISTAKNTMYQSVFVPVLKQWTVYIYPHSHVDIGYTNTQEFVRKLHMRNIDVAIDIAKKTQNYPEGSRFVWNPEANWVTENYLKEASPEKRKTFIEAVKKGWISLDGDYANVNTSACTDEELLRLFHSGHEISAITGTPIKTMVQMDIAGVSWGIVQAAYQNGIRGFFLYPNIGTIRQPWEHRPFYWVAPDGKSKIFFLQALPYGFGYDIKGSKIGLHKTQGNDPSLDRITTGKPDENFVGELVFSEISRLEGQRSPYDIMVLPWALADNALIDADLPDAVRNWNERFAFPKLIISGSQRIMDDYEKRYGDIIPEVKGDYSEYWTDGLGTDAKRVGEYRRGTENIVQAETAWSMLNATKPSPRKLVDSAWENCLLGAEHTWGYQDPKAPLAKQIEQTKASFFENSLKNSDELLNAAFKSIKKETGNKIAVFNTLSWDRDGLVTLSKEQSKTGDRVLDEKGNEMPSQRLSSGQLAFMAKQVHALGSATYTISAGQSSLKNGCSITGNTLSNGNLSLYIDPETGDISSLKNIKTGQEYVDKKSKYGLNSYRYLLETDTANIGSKPYNIKLKIKDNGPLVASVVISSSAEGCNWLTRQVQLVQGQPWVDMTNSLDKISTRTKEGIHFGFAFNVSDGNTRLDIPWGIMIPEYDQLTGSNKSWLTFQHWVDISNNETGITWTSIEAPLIEMGEMTANVLGGAHGRKNWYKTLPKTQTLFSWALNNHWGTNFPLEQGGVMSFHYALLPHQAYDAVAANRFGLEQNRPLIAIPVDRDLAVKSRVNIGNPNVLISILKQSDDDKGMILRVRSVSDKPEKVMLSWPNGKPRKLYTCMADEKPEKPITNDQTILPSGTISYYFEL